MECPPVDICVSSGADLTLSSVLLGFFEVAPYYVPVHVSGDDM